MGRDWLGAGTSYVFWSFFVVIVTSSHTINTLVLWPPHRTSYLSIIPCEIVLRLNTGYCFPWVCNQGIESLALCATGMEIDDGADRDCSNGSSRSRSWFLKVLKFTLFHWCDEFLSWEVHEECKQMKRTWNLLPESMQGFWSDDFKDRLEDNHRTSG